MRKRRRLEGRVGVDSASQLMTRLKDCGVNEELLTSHNGILLLPYPSIAKVPERISVTTNDVADVAQRSFHFMPRERLKDVFNDMDRLTFAQFQVGRCRDPGKSIVQTESSLNEMLLYGIPGWGKVCLLDNARPCSLDRHP